MKISLALGGRHGIHHLSVTTMNLALNQSIPFQQHLLSPEHVSKLCPPRYFLAAASAMSLPSPAAVSGASRALGRRFISSGVPWPVETRKY